MKVWLALSLYLAAMPQLGHPTLKTRISKEPVSRITFRGCPPMFISPKYCMS